MFDIYNLCVKHNLEECVSCKKIRMNNMHYNDWCIFYTWKTVISNNMNIGNPNMMDLLMRSYSIFKNESIYIFKAVELLKGKAFLDKLNIALLLK